MNYLREIYVKLKLNVLGEFIAAIGAASRSQVLYESTIAIVMLRNKQSPNSAAYSISVLSMGVREARAWPCSAGLSFRPRAALGLFHGSH